MTGGQQDAIGTVLRRGLGVGAAYGAAYLGCELVGAMAVLAVAGTQSVLNLVAVELVRLAAGYIAFGAAWGLVTALPAAWLRRRVPSRMAWGPLTDGFILACVYVAIALGWNPESVLQRSAYVVAAVCAAGALVPGWLALRWSRRKLGLALRRWAVAAAAVVVVVAGAAYALSLRTGERVATWRPGTSAPNVLLIVVDTLRRDHVSVYGYERETTPNLDRLAREGALVENAFAPEPWTLPSHASLFTGLMPREHQCHVAHRFLTPEHRTLAEALKGAGYRTASFSANPWVSRVSGLDQGFDLEHNLGTETVAGFLFLNLVVRRIVEPDLGGAAVTRAIIDEVDANVEVGAPFFIFANYMEAHEPYGSVPEPYYSMYLSSPVPRGSGREWLRETPKLLCASCEPADVAGLECKDGRWRATEEHIAATVDLYDAGVRYVDDQIGAVVAHLRERGVLDDTVVIVTSDHGEMLGERGRIGHGVHLYGSLIEIPMLLRHPKTFAAGTRITHPVSLVDLMPTIEAITGVVSPGTAYARSLFTKEADLGRTGILAEHVPAEERHWKMLGEVVGCDLSAFGVYRSAYQEGTAKVISNSDDTRELYDLEEDPREEQNLAEREPARTTELEARLRAELGRLRAAAQKEGSPELDEVTRERLRSLGYVH